MEGAKQALHLHTFLYVHNYVPLPQEAEDILIYVHACIYMYIHVCVYVHTYVCYT